VPFNVGLVELAHNNDQILFTVGKDPL
jgi:hypothetical protein